MPSSLEEGSKDSSAHQGASRKPGQPPPQPGAFVPGWEMSVAVNKDIPLKILLVFHVSHLKPVRASSLCPPPPSSIQGCAAYVVRRLLDCQTVQGRAQYLVDWDGVMDHRNVGTGTHFWTRLSSGTHSAAGLPRSLSASGVCASETGSCQDPGSRRSGQSTDQLSHPDVSSQDYGLSCSPVFFLMYLSFNPFVCNLFRNCCLQSTLIIQRRLLVNGASCESVDLLLGSILLSTWQERGHCSQAEMS